MNDHKSAEYVGACLGGVLLFFFRAWLVMIFVGMIHADVASVPAVGFGISCLLCAIGTLITLDQSSK